MGTLWASKEPPGSGQVGCPERSGSLRHRLGFREEAEGFTVWAALGEMSLEVP